MGKLTKRKHDLFNADNSGGYTYSETVADGITSKPVIIKPTGRGTTSGTVILTCGSNQGKVQAYFGEESNVNSGTWHDWQKYTDGVYTGTILDVFNAPVTALRAVSISGEIKFEILI